MYSIALKQNQYPTYILSDQTSGARIEVVPERGGIITQWHIHDTQILYFDAERFSDPSQSVRGGIPILFPICGNLPDNTYSLKDSDHTFTLKQHGFARDLPWSVSDRSANADEARLQLTLESSETTRRVYPFDFLLTYTYRLQGDRLILEQQYSNTGDRPMPFSTGLHPYFQVEGTPAAKSQLQLEIPATQYTDHLTHTEQPYRGSLDWSVPEIDIAFRPISAQQASIRDPKRQVQLSLEYDSAYTTLVFWTVEGKDYYCLEPWSAPRNALNTSVDLLNLAPGESQTLTVTFTAQISNR